MTILFIDDDPDDTELFCEAVSYLNKAEFIPADKVSIDCVPLNNGLKALEILPTLSEFPDYIFLDMNMPVMGGRECLSRLKADPDYCRIPVIMFSTAFAPNEQAELKAMGASDCILKPNGFNELVKILSKFVYKKYVQ